VAMPHVPLVLTLGLHLALSTVPEFHLAIDQREDGVIAP
jgi:hypothetical protein